MELEVKKRNKLKGSWIEMLFGEESAGIFRDTRAIDFINDASYSVEYKLKILAACIDVLNDEVKTIKDNNIDTLK